MEEAAWTSSFTVSSPPVSSCRPSPPAAPTLPALLAALDPWLFSPDAVSPWKRFRRENLRRTPILVSSRTFCRGTSLISSHRRCLVVSISSEHAVNDLKRTVSPWKKSSGESRQGFTSDAPPSSRGTSLASSHRRCLVVSRSPGHAVNDLGFWLPRHHTLFLYPVLKTKNGCRFAPVFTQPAGGEAV